VGEGEINLEDTDDEEENEEEATQHDIDFLDDGEYDVDGTEQARCQNDAVNDENQNHVQCYRETMQKVRGRKRKSNEGEDGENDKKQKKRSDRRQLLVTMERGIGECTRSVVAYHNKAPFHMSVADLVTPWENQPGRKKYDFGADIGKLEYGAFGDEEHRRWVNDIEQRHEFAKLFYIPMYENVPLRALSTDVPNTNVNVEFCRTNSTTKILHAFRVMHPKTELDYMEDRFYEKVLLGSQRTTRELRQNIDAGPFGGLQGRATDVLWKVYSGDEVSNLDTSTLQLVQAIAMALQGKNGDELWPMVRTQYTEPYVRGKTGMTKVQSGVQTLRDYNFHNASQHCGRSAVDDLDPRIVKKVWRYRFGEEEVPWSDKDKLSKLVHKRFQKFKPELAHTDIKAEPQKPSTDPVIVDMWVYKDIFQVWDEKNKIQTNVTLEGIYICAKAPACDPLVILRSIAENNPTASTLLSGYFAHMMQVLGLEVCPWDQLFNTDRAGATDVVSEAAMLQGVFMFCEAQGLRNLNVGGFRMDVCNENEMRLWEKYMRTITSARRKHYEIMTREVLHDRSSHKDSQFPVEDWALDFVHGATYWKVPVQKVLTEMKEYEELFDDIDDREHVKTELFEWFRGHYFEDGQAGCEPKNIFLCEGVGFAMNTGIWIKIRTDNKESYNDEHAPDRGKRGKSEELCMLPQPQQQNPMVRLWCANMCDTHDPLDEVFCHSALVPDMKWMTEEMPKLDRAVDSMQVLRETIGDVVVIAHSKKQTGVNARLREIMLLTGKERSALRDKISNIEEHTHIKFLYKLKMNKITTAIKQTLQIMSSCELAMWRLAALGVRDLKRQSSSMQDKWREDYSHTHNMCANLNTHSWEDLLCFSTAPSLFYTQSLTRIDSDLSYMNTFLQIIMRNSFMAFGMNTPGAYGMTLRIGDMAISTKILTEGDGKDRGKNTNVMVFDTKFPGMGIDQCTGNLFQQCNAAMIHISLTKEHREMAMLAVDCSMKTISKFSFSTLQGSGVLVNSSGEILPTCTDWQKKCGLLVLMSEWGKDNMDISTMGCIESNLANSGDQDFGAESGVQQSSWQTTQFLESLGDFKIRKLPILFITGNKPSTATPASAIEGGRWVHIASSTQDNDNGFFIIARGEFENISKPSVPRIRCFESVETDHDNDASDSVSAQAMFTNMVSTQNVRRDIKTIKREVVLRNRIYFLLMQWMKRDAVLLLSALTSDPKTFSYTMRCNFGNIEAAVGMFTFGLRREYLQKLDGKFWHRNAVGPWSKVTQVSTHVHLTLTSSVLSSMESVMHGWPLDLHLAFELGIRSVLTQNISFPAMLNSLHIWLSSAVLDINVMILSSFVYNFTGFQHTCSLRVLSLAITGQLLVDEDEDDWKSYMAFCEFMAPCLLEENMLRTNLLPNARMRTGPRNVCMGVLQIPTSDMLSKWSNNSTDQLTMSHPSSAAYGAASTNQQDLEIAYQARVHGPQQETFSVYCQPRLSFVHSDAIKGFGRSKDGQHYIADDNISGTATRALATMLAREQKPSAHRSRKECGVPMFEHEDTGEFWKHVQTGTALPQSNNSTNDVYKLKFEEPQYTGIWWDETVKNAGLCDGALKLFLLQSKMDPSSITEHQFWTKLLTPYLKHTSSTRRVYGGPMAPGKHKNAWSSLVLDKKNMFEFASSPFKNDQGEFKGVHMNICMRLVHYMIMQGLGLTRDWNTTAHDNSSFVSCVHLRNMSHISLGLLSMFLHTCCDKSLIPANSGNLRLAAPTPEFMVKEEAKIEYDARLHTDTHQHMMGGKSDNMLSVASRMANNSNWHTLLFANGESVLWYTPVIRDCVQMSQARTRANLFPFPPESVAHTAFMFDDMFLANRRYIEVLEKQRSSDEMHDDEQAFHQSENVFALAMLHLGNSMNFELCAHMQPSLTECTVRDAREIPCVTFEHGFLFTIAFRDGWLYLRPTYKTHKWAESEELQLRENMPFSHLPLQNEQHEVVLSSAYFFMLFRHGLNCQKVDNHVVSVNVTVNYTDNKKLPFYMFPVMHFPFLLRLEHSGWSIKDTASLLLNTSEYFYWKHRMDYVFRDSGDTWLLQKCPEVCKLLGECHAARPAVHIQAYFLDSTSTKVLGFWATEKDVQVHFGSTEQVWQQLTKDAFCDTSAFISRQKLNYNAGESVEGHDLSYLMLECKKHGLVPVCNSDGVEGEEPFVARFSYVDDDGNKMEKITRFPNKFDNTTPRLLPLGEESMQMKQMYKQSTSIQNVWGLVIENASGGFLCDGCHTVNSVAFSPCGKHPVPISFEMDFISTSRCMLVEGNELWITITHAVYGMVLQQAKEQGFRIMLPVSEELHTNMQGPRLLRAFYVLGGSVHDKNIDVNTVRLICIIANKKSVPGKQTTQDDNADTDSIVNQEIEQQHTRMIAISLPILDTDRGAVFSYKRDESLPFYKYFKERLLTRDS
jgi:hypothetical protein